MDSTKSVTETLRFLGYLLQIVACLFNILFLQFVQIKLEKPNFKGFPFENFEDEANKFRNWTDRLHECYKKNIQRQILRNPNDKNANKKIDKLKAERLLCSHVFPGLMAQLATHPPRLPFKPP